MGSRNLGFFCSTCLRQLGHDVYYQGSEPVLFSTSVAENIAYAKPGATISEIVEAANVHQFIRGLPNGYDTLVGGRGMQLSGEERQRASLARAFLKNAPILLPDEPISSVDLKTETLIMEALKRLMQGHTSLIIAHRSNRLKRCDLHLQKEGGRQVSVGSTLEVAS
jgi:ATP-binding cassette subfamily B protein